MVDRSPGLASGFWLLVSGFLTLASNYCILGLGSCALPTCGPAPDIPIMLNGLRHIYLGLGGKTCCK